ncbi:hypothetical protein BDZ97DRAFT_403720 [Flammula alnicola]|nr:hypothetical protein BDZ97DRAFT_403720 [Flammula alnicola]
MTSTATLLPTTVALSSDSAIESILTDIPLFCEGIMGIGVFTFLFITKQVTCLSLFLYGSSFLAFAAATFDLGQVLARETHNDTATGIGLNTIAGVIFSREIFLSLSVLLLDLFFWTLVARCPRGECTERSNELSTDRRRRLPSMHSASWNRWGLIGTILKWGSLAALLSVPLLQMLWRLLPGQRKYAAIYVAESTIQTSITAIFILKFFLNVYISPLDYWWHAFRIYIVPITSLIIGVALGIGNLIVFSFTETSLGRLLRAVEVYLLIVHNLYTTFQYVSSPLQRPGQESNLPSQKTQPEKSPYTNTLPFAYASGYPQFATVAPMIVPQRSEGSLRASTMTWGLPPRRTPSPSQSHIQELDVETAPTSNEVTRNVSRSEPRQHKDSLVGVGVSSGQPRASEGTRVEQEPPGSERPYTAVSLSYYTMDPNSPQTMKQDLPRSSKPKTIPLDYSNGKNERMEGSTRYQPFKLTPPSIGSQQASITSIDELLRQQTELDKSIAALRLVSMSMQTDISSPSKIKNPEPTSRTASTAPDQSRSTLVSSKTESFSNRSDFSLSVFPNPPIIPRDEVATKYTVEEVRKGETPAAVVQNSEKKNLEPLTIIPLSNAALQSPAQVHLDSAPTQYDVTSFIGG